MIEIFLDAKKRQYNIAYVIWLSSIIVKIWPSAVFSRKIIVSCEKKSYICNGIGTIPYTLIHKTTVWPTQQLIINPK